MIATLSSVKINTIENRSNLNRKEKVNVNLFFFLIKTFSLRRNIPNRTKIMSSSNMNYLIIWIGTPFMTQE